MLHRLLTDEINVQSQFLLNEWMILALTEYSSRRSLPLTTTNTRLAVKAHIKALGLG